MIAKTSRDRLLSWLWLGFLAVLMGIGVFFYLLQLNIGLGITGMNQNVTWGLYISQFTFLVGIAASAVMLILPYYLHEREDFANCLQVLCS